MTTALIVEDDAKIRAALEFQLREEGLDTTAVEGAEEALTRLEAAPGPYPDLMLVDVRLPGLSGVELVRRLVDVGRLPPTIIVSGEASIAETVEALKLGVHDFIEKPVSKERLLQSVRNTLETTDLRREVQQLRTALQAERELLGESPAMLRLREQIARAAPTEARVLIRGESGTGKELVADSLHRHGPRAGRPLIKVNCAAFPEHLIENELFGHVKGAFTDARADKPGLFEEADGGTLFLDEIGDMEVELQSRLLRVLEDGRVRRIGDRRDREVDVRVIAATHTDLGQAVRDGRFREDLFFRLAHLPIDMPPLREREGDVPLLFEHFLELFRRAHHARVRRVEPEVMRLLEAYTWPGNVRELKSLCERLVVFGGDPITAEDLPEPYRGGGLPAEPLLRTEGGQPVLSLRQFRRLAEKEYIEQVLRHTGWNITAAARLLGLQRTYLHRKMTDLGAERDDLDDESS
jgi:two-component system nitrogen regulation response regulator NtrX